MTFILHAQLLFSQIDHWETTVFENDSWKLLVPSSAVDSDWNTLSFSDIGWTTAPGGFGYGDGDDNTTVPAGTISIYQRIQFDITDTAAIEAAALTVDYDDSFIAYLNGVEISRDLLSGTPGWDETSEGLHEAEIYQGIYPSQYVINKSFLQANLNEGANVLCVQVHNESVWSSDMSSRVWLHLGINNSSSDYSPVPTWFVEPVVLSVSNLPIVVINTADGVSIPNEPKVDAVMGIIHNGDGEENSVSDPFNEFYGNIGIEIRGSSSSTFPKKSFGLETRGPDSSNYNVSIFDWPLDNDWILYAPYSDKSLIRNVLTYKLGNEMGNYSPRTKLVEVVINGQYEGVYVFMERIKVNPGRVNIDELAYEDIGESQLTGGYIVKIDKTTSGGVVAWTSPYPQAAPATGPIEYQLHDPEIDTINPAQLAYIQNYITDFETALNGPDYADEELGYRPYIDVLSFIDFMIVNEISKNVDGYRISTFFHKEEESIGGKYIAGPLWDFNLAWGNANYCEGGLTSGWEIYFNNVCGGPGGLNNPNYWNVMVTDPVFAHELNCRWQELRMSTLHTDSILVFIDEMELYLEQAADRNFSRWQILGNYVWPNNFVGESYTEEMDYLRAWTTERLSWVDANMFGSCPDLSAGEEFKGKIILYPNPVGEYLKVNHSLTVQDASFAVVDALGRTVLSGFRLGPEGIIRTEALTPGSYILILRNVRGEIVRQKFIKR